MPCLDISTNVNLHGVDLDSVFSEATKTVAAIVGKPDTVPDVVSTTRVDRFSARILENHHQFVMVLLKGSVPISFGGNKEPAALGEIVSMGGITKEVKRKLIVAIGTILETKLSIPRTRFVLKVFDTTMGRNQSKL